MCSFQWLRGGTGPEVWGQGVFEAPAEGAAKLPSNRARGGRGRNEMRHGQECFCSASRKPRVSPVLSSHGAGGGSLVRPRRVRRGGRGPEGGRGARAAPPSGARQGSAGGGDAGSPGPRPSRAGERVPRRPPPAEPPPELPGPRLPTGLSLRAPGLPGAFTPPASPPPPRR